MPDIYCVDTSSLIALHRQFPRDVFPGVWENVEKLVASGRLLAPKEVFAEIERGDDELVSWARRHTRMFRPLDAVQIEAARQILAEFPSLADASKETPQADPFVIALAKIGNERPALPLLPNRHVVVTEERRRGIPTACARYSIECISLLELFRKEGWRFRS